MIFDRGSMTRHNHELISTVDLDQPPTPLKSDVSKAGLETARYTKPAVAARIKKNVIKVGYWQLSVLICGNIALILAAAVLWYLWDPVGRAELSEDSFWHTIIFSGWMLRVITLTSIIIRTSMTMQATVFCMFVASITLQRGVLMQNIAAVSIYRFTNSGPHNMILPLFFARKGWKSDVAMMMTALLSLTTLSSQFTSTILLMDVGIAQVVTPAIMESVSYGGDPEQRFINWVSSFGNTWTERPANFPVFGELPTTELVLQNEENGGSLYATGNINRVFLPLDKVSREMLVEYIGPAAGIDSRVFCIPPTFQKLTRREDNYITANISIDTYLEHSDKLRAVGWTGQSGFSRSSPYVDFACVIPSVLDGDAPFFEWKVSLCARGGQGFDVQDETSSDVPLGTAWLVLNATGYKDLWGNITVPEDYVPKYDFDGEWTKFSYPVDEGNSYGLKTYEMSASLCFSSTASYNYYVRVTGNWNHTEPKLLKNDDGISYNTTAIRKFIGAYSGTTAEKSPESRGILELDGPPDYNRSDVMLGTDSWIGSSLIDSKLLNTESNFAPTAVMCIWCTLGVDVHEGYITIFENTLRETSHSALAVQALLTTRALQIFEGRRDDFTISELAHVKSVQDFQVPMRIQGLSAIMALIAFHMILMIYVVVLFVQMRGHTSLGQSWQAVAQLEGEETMEAIAFAKRATDPEVADWLTKRGMNTERIGVSKEGKLMWRGGKRVSCEYARAPDYESAE